eukprot:TRINITY_DN1776_c0_g1_i1.p1 TRINITY_DN1776_c0_g1~~TRINITY_DN1776_c0_g1_i1.p1  ORF type:complete len:259 (+),score=59.39 TRINITY_DN1776_c0_g1_i1:100-876(+)
MCFNQPMSFAMAGIGLLCSIAIYFRTKNLRLSGGMFFFFTMEFLQGFQYIWIDDCDNTINKVLTLLGLIHIILQPFFTHLICSALALDEKTQAKYQVILQFCLLGALWLLLRLLMSPWASDFIDTNSEWLRGTQICTYSGEKHLAWSVPLYDQTYFTAASSIHFFLMFAPFFVMGKSMIILGTFLLITGPVLASYVTPNLQEQASIWCFYSCAQTALMMLLYKFEHGTDHLPYKKKILAERERKRKLEAEKNKSKKSK